jgi:virginiamycin A acetyltransferase
MKKIIKNLLNKLGLLTFMQVNMACFVDHRNKRRRIKTKITWRNLNQHNHTTVGNTGSDMNFPIDKVTVGKQSYGPLCVHHFGSANEELKIGNYCSISRGVKFILGGNHSTETFSTFPFRHFYNHEECEAWSKGPIIIEDDVWIGTDVLIMSGVTIGKGTIVAAGSIVTRSTTPYSIVGGNPAKTIKMRFDESIINLLLDLDLNKIDEKRIRDLLSIMYMPVSDESLKKIKKELLK